MHMYYLGIAYLYGIDVEINKNKAVRLLESAAEKGAADAAKRISSIILLWISFEKRLHFSSSLAKRN